MRKLSVVVTCTERKSACPLPELRARSLPKEVSVSGRADMWMDRLRMASNQSRLMDLYQGEHWAQVRNLMTTAADRGWSAALWVASAGLGLQSVDATAPPYAATFSSRHADSVATTGRDASEWWRHLQGGYGRTTLERLSQRGQLLLILSESYGRALRTELLALAERGASAILFGGADDVSGLTRIRSDRRLRSALGGTLTSLNVRMAGTWLQTAERHDLTSRVTEDAWRRWVISVSRDDQPRRRPLRDDEVMQFIRTAKRRYPDHSRTRLHRLLRESGMACEQGRFAQLYSQIEGGDS